MVSGNDHQSFGKSTRQFGLLFDDRLRQSTKAIAGTGRLSEHIKKYGVVKLCWSLATVFKLSSQKSFEYKSGFHKREWKEGKQTPNSSQMESILGHEKKKTYRHEM